MKFSIRRLYSRVQAHFFLKGTVLNTVALKMHHLIYFPQAPGLSNKSIVFADNMKSFGASLEVEAPTGKHHSGIDSHIDTQK